MVSSAFRGVLQTFVAMAVFGELVSSKRWLGIALTVGGSCLYTWVRHQESLAIPTHQFEKCPADEENPKVDEKNSMKC
jgi:hypothetical protein